MANSDLARATFVSRVPLPQIDTKKPRACSDNWYSNDSLLSYPLLHWY
jgi:hypothetical protein